MVDAAVGSRAIIGRGIEKVNVGLPTTGPDDLTFINFETADLSRNSKENPSLAITGFGGDDRGTPGEVVHEKKFKYDSTVRRLLEDLTAMYGKPAGSDKLAAPLDPSSVVITAPGSTYVEGDSVTVTDVGGGTGAVGTVHVSTGAVVGIVWTSLGDGYVTPLIDLTGHGDGLATATVAPKGVWLVKFRPGAQQLPETRSMSLLRYEGGDYTAYLDLGRRVADITLTDAANKRVQADITYTEPTGDTVSGYPIAKSGNTGTQEIDFVGTRGRRPYDANYTNKKSLYLKVIATDAAFVTFAAAYDAASGHTDGTGFPTVSYGTFHFTVNKADWGTAIDSNDVLGAPIGLFGENNEPYEVTIGDQAGTLFAVDDQFEIPYALSAPTKTVVAENRLSTFHLTNAVNGASVLIDSGTTKWMRPYKEYYSNSRRLPSQIDPTDALSASMQFKKRLFDIAFREIQEQAQRAAVVQSYVIKDPISHNVFEGIEAFYPQMRVDTMKSGDIPNRNTLEETMTLMAEQPSADVSAQPTSILTPGGSHYDIGSGSAAYVMQINAVTTIDPSYLS